MGKGRKPAKRRKNQPTKKADAFIQKGARGGTFFTVNAGMSTLDLLQHTLQSSNQPSLRKLTRYQPSHSILLIGEGDFTFASALATALNLQPRPKLASSSSTLRSSKIMHSGPVLIATSYDSLKDVTTKYADTYPRLQDLRTSRGVIIHHNVDATKLSTDERFNAYEFDKVIFNFPHVGGGKEEDVEVNKVMLGGFFREARDILRNGGGGVGGEVHVSLRDTPFYEKFKIETLAEEQGYELVERVPFDTERWTALGYKPQRTNPAVRAAPSLEDAMLYVFRLAGGEGNGDAETDEDINGTDEQEEVAGADREVEVVPRESKKRPRKEGKVTRKEKKLAAKRASEEALLPLESVKPSKKGKSGSTASPSLSSPKTLEAPNKSPSTETALAKQTLPPSKKPQKGDPALHKVKAGSVVKGGKRSSMKKALPKVGNWEVKPKA
jgi:25S rRNA (uracil2634-N3)-methyltransferase